MGIEPDNLDRLGHGNNWHTLAGWLLLALAVLPFAEVRHYPHVHDDHVLRGPGSLAADARTDLVTLLGADFFGTFEHPRGQTGFWRPLVLASFRAEALVAGRSEAGYVWLGHVVTVLCHAAAVLALWRLVLCLGLSPGAALVAAALFALHPVHVESVAWASGRTDSLPTALGFGAIAIALREPRSLSASCQAAALLTAALLCKETALLLVVLLPLLARVRGVSWGRSLAPSAVALLIAVGLRAAHFGLLPSADPAAYMGPTEVAVRWFTWLSILPDMLRLLIWPGAATPIHPVLPATELASPGVLAGALVFSVVAVGGVLAWRRRSAVGLAMAGLLGGTMGMLAPWVSVPTGFSEVAGPLYERYLYAAAAAPALLLAHLLARWLGSGRGPALVLALLLGATLGPITAERARMWSSEQAFARAGLAVAPRSANLWNHLGTALLDEARRSGERLAGEQALSAFEHSLELDPEGRLAALNRFIALALLGRDDEASDAAQVLFQRWPGDPGVLHNVAGWLMGLGVFDRAAALYEQELATGEALPGARESLTYCRRQLGLPAVEPPPGPEAGSGR